MDKKKYCCDYDTIYHYKSGEFNCRYKTELKGKVQEIERMPLNQQDVFSFLNGEYKTYITTDEIVLYRVFGTYLAKNSGDAKGAYNSGRFFSTEFAESPLDAKMRLALDPTWKNPRMFEAKVLVPTGIVINVGIVAPITTLTGTVFPGGADQVMLPHGLNEEWIQGYRRLAARQIYKEPNYPIVKPDPIILGDSKRICPSCCDTNTVKLDESERFEIIGACGGKYTMQYHCLNENCGYYW